ncbi:MAG: TrkH family potassium uptake protein [Bacteriovoracaceae bacterium]|nr:TrkH family potassium uptake protein [Bacteriovoracaceae bacterium]
MTSFMQKIPFLLELFFNGSFILLYSLKNTKKLPSGWDENLIDTILTYGVWGVPLVLLLVVVVNFINSTSLDEYLRRYIFSLVVFIPLILTWGDMQFAFWFSSAHLLSSVLALYDDDSQEDFMKKINPVNGKFFQRLKLKPAQLVILSFSSVIFLGTFLLMLPVASKEGQTLAFIDAFFMSTSATCVTGLSTVSLSENFSMFGQVVILILIQIGGLSIMTLYSSMTILLGRSIGMKDRIIMQDLLDVSSLEELFQMIIDIIKYTFFIELWGGIVLTIAFTFEGFEFSKALYYGFFHSISAFCNAGFSLFDTSLESYSTNPLINFTVITLITAGGLGFIVLKELTTVITNRKKLSRIGMHSKVVLITSFSLTIVGALLFFFGEFLNALDSYSIWDKMQISLFQSVTLRTAGFNTIPLNNLNQYSIYAMTLFMFIGGSPGSTAGGVKTTTLAILVQSIISTLKGDKQVRILDRTIPGPIVVRAIALTFFSILMTSGFILVMMRMETEQSFLTIFFEVISASGTVGLSLGITSFLTTWGKFIMSIVMLIGRIGPLTLILAIGQRADGRGKFDYPDGRIMIG